MKLCPKCGFKKSTDEFYERKLKTKVVLQTWCKKCTQENKIIWRKENPEKDKLQRLNHYANNKSKFKSYRRKAQLKNMYGLSLEDFDRILKSQNNKCAICSTEKIGGRFNQWHVDHDHKTNTVRGILCPDCNVGLGLLHDDIQSLSMAIQYLIKSKKETIAA